MSAERPVSVEVGRDRCPYCREEVGPSPDKTGCESCQAWHHRACWDAHGACSACGYRRPEAAGSPGAAPVASAAPAVPAEPASACRERSCSRPAAGRELPKKMRPKWEEYCAVHAHRSYGTVMSGTGVFCLLLALGAGLGVAAGWHESDPGPMAGIRERAGGDDEDKAVVLVVLAVTIAITGVGSLVVGASCFATAKRHEREEQGGS